jgi:excisionase family DNA binding protein
MLKSLHASERNGNERSNQLNEEKIFNTDEVAKHLRVSKRTLLREVEAGKIEAFKVGNALRFTKKAVDDYIERQKIKPGEKIEEDKEASLA